MEAEEATDVRIHYEDVFSGEGRDLEKEGRIVPQTPRQTAIEALKIWGYLFAVSIVWGLLDAVRGRDLGAPCLAAIAIVTCAVVTVSPVLLLEELYRASHWHRWRRVLRILPFLELNPLFRRRGYASSLLQGFRATALVGLGRVQEGLDLSARATQINGADSPARDAGRATLLIRAKRHAEAIALRRRAAEQDPKYAIDAAIALLRYGDGVEEARVLLSSREGVALTRLELALLRYAQGILAVAEQRYDAALAALDEARSIADADLRAHPAQHEGLTSFFDAYRVIALARLGRTESASSLLAQVEPILTASEEIALLASCREAIARGPDRYRGPSTPE